MTEPLGWARVRPPGAYMLRRGAWYPVVNDKAKSLVFLDVGRRNVAVPRTMLQIRRHLPDRFSLVVREPSESNPKRDTPEDMGTTYAVCPSSRSRIPISGHPDWLECPVCGYRYEVGWDDEC